MPLYDYQCPKCQHEFEKNVKIAIMHEAQECPECQTASTRVIRGAPSMGDPIRLGLIKPSDVFRDRLREIHKKNPGSQLNRTSSYI